jgi:hypothetical protein
MTIPNPSTTSDNSAKDMKILEKVKTVSTPGINEKIEGKMVTGVQNNEINKSFIEIEEEDDFLIAALYSEKNMKIINLLNQEVLFTVSTDELCDGAMIMYSAIFCSVNTSNVSTPSNEAEFDKSKLPSSRNNEKKYNIKNFMKNKFKKTTEFKKNSQFFHNFYGLSLNQGSEGVPLFFSFKSIGINATKNSIISKSGLVSGSGLHDSRGTNSGNERKSVNCNNVENIILGVEITQFDALFSIICIWTTRKLYFVSCKTRKNRVVDEKNDTGIGSVNEKDGLKKRGSVGGRESERERRRSSVKNAVGLSVADGKMGTGIENIENLRNDNEYDYDVVYEYIVPHDRIRLIFAKVFRQSFLSLSESKNSGYTNNGVCNTNNTTDEENKKNDRKIEIESIVVLSDGTTVKLNFIL